MIVASRLFSHYSARFPAGVEIGDREIFEVVGSETYFSVIGRDEGWAFDAFFAEYGSEAQVAEKGFRNPLRGIDPAKAYFHGDQDFNDQLGMLRFIDRAQRDLGSITINSVMVRYNEAKQIELVRIHAAEGERRRVVRFAVTNASGTSDPRIADTQSPVSRESLVGLIEAKF